jgi:subtilisin family serine protease
MKIALVSALIGLSTMASAANFNGYIVKLKEGSQAFTEKSFQALGNVEALNVSFGNFVKLDSNLLEGSKALDELSNHPDVLYVEPNYIYSINPVVEKNSENISDRMYSKQWGLKNTGKNSGGWVRRGKAGEDINAEKAWEITKGSKDIIVAVIDTGIDYNHPDLKENLLVNEAELNGQEGIDDDGNGYVDDVYGYDFANKDGNPTDGHSHGTHCAGVIGASHNNEGIRGVMANVKLLGIKFLSDSGSGETVNAIYSIEYAMKRGAHILSNSWGGGAKSEALKEAIQAAADQGIIFVAAAGNSYSNNDSRPTYPASYKVDNIITVGSMDGKGKKSGFSNYGEKSVHIFAPGSDILSTVKNGGYKKMSGTSMATPFVSGILGLLLSQERGMSVENAKERLLSTAVRTRALNGKSQTGRADAYKMLTNNRQN